jgi:REP element-mobilizing transposase RayT
MSSDFRNRKQLRLTNYDYSQNGAYFVTMCTRNRECIFGDVVDGKMVLNDIGEMVFDTWNDISIFYSDMELGAFIIMPNHMHGIVSIIDKIMHMNAVGARSPRPNMDQNMGGETPPLRRITLGNIVGYFKYQTTKCINVLNNCAGTKIWQRGYYEHIIRNENDHDRICEYIMNNPAAWEDDDENPT